MITFWQQIDGMLQKCDKTGIDPEKNLWVDARSVTKDDITVLRNDYGIEMDDIVDILDQEELSRVERDDSYTLIVLRAPVASDDAGVPYFTVPLGIVFYGKALITVCWTDCEVLRGISSRRIKDLDLSDFAAFAIQILNRSSLLFLRCLKEINRRSNVIQNELQVSIENDALLELLNLEKSLVLFTTSLSSNQLLIEKLLRSSILTWDQNDREWLNDVEIDNRQAIEMARTYSNILMGTIESFASVISNNLNVIMKKLTVISLVLMIPTFIVSFFGMNVPLPFAGKGHLGTVIISGICIVSMCIATLFLRNKPVQTLRRYHRSKNRKGGLK
ncbi:MAG: magnesium transporter CorA family protein [Spirochaetaceae bacterium]|nr:magnesium transporter CorA family protein [Spirochaetaceae bacterium]